MQAMPSSDPLLDPLLLRIVLPCVVTLDRRASALSIVSPWGHIRINHVPGLPAVPKPLHPHS